MEPVSAIASVVALYQLASTVSGLCFRYGQGVRRADRDADHVINEIEIFQRYLRTLKETLAKEDAATGGVDRLRNLNEIVNGESAPMKLCRKDLENIQTKLVKVQAEGRFKDAVHRLSWPLKQEEVSKTLGTLKKFTESVDRALNMDNNEAIREIDNRTKHIQNSLESAKSQQKQEKESFQLSQEQQRDSEMKEKILDWLAHPDPSEIHTEKSCARNNRAKTGRWFLDGDLFQKFKATPRSVLWLHGDSGCGKSVLCSAIINEILAVPSGGSQTELIYWYFSATDKKWTTIKNLLRALITQLVLRRPIPPFLRDLWSSRQMGREAPKTTDLVQIIPKLLSAEPSHTYFVIIDALDESDESERTELIQLVRCLALYDADIHIVVTSRTNTAGIETQMRDLNGFCSIAVEGENTEIDILAHITERLENDVALAKWSPELRQIIKDTLVEKAGGMFRWVECQLQAIRSCRKPAEVRKTLNTLPKDLHEVYARDLAKVDESASQDVVKLLEWLAFPQQKLRIEEAVEMLAVDMESDPPAFDGENRMVEPEEIVKMCGCLVRLDTNAEGQDEMGDVANVQTLTAAHTSVIDFLQTQPLKIGSAEVFRLSRSKANLRMAETCLIYLRYFCENDITLTENNIASYPFARLCAVIWNDFYQRSLASRERADMARLNGLVMEMFSSPTATLNWVKLSNPDNRPGRPKRVDFDIEQSQVKPAIYYAAYLGLPDIVKTLIQNGDPVDEVVGPRFGTPLVAACAMGRTNVASLLLDNGADPNLSGYFYYGTPLADAIEYGSVDTVKFLLERKGVDLNGIRHPPVEATEEVLGKVDEYRFLRAMIGEDENDYEYKKLRDRCIEIGTELIELAKNAIIGDWEDENLKEMYGSDDIMSENFQEQGSHSAQATDTEDKCQNICAISDGLDETHYHKILICADIALKTIEISTQSMVYIAAGWATPEILETLLAAGADPNVRGGGYCTALQRACAFNGGKLVRTLLETGARPDVYGGRCGTPLNAACVFGSIGIVEDLIASGADVNQFDRRYHLPLFHASAMNRADVVKFLLENGAETDLYVGNKESPLQLTSGAGNIEITQLLLDAGSDVNWKAGTKRTALYMACNNRNKEMVELLLANGADPNIQQCGIRDHALQVACENGDEEIISLLLENGAKTDLQSGYLETALQAARVSGKEPMTPMLLSHGLDVNLSVWLYCSPLVTACGQGKLAIAKILVAAGADLHVTNLIGHSALLRTILSHASRLDMFDYLISLGADPLQGDKRGCNGIHYAARTKKGDVIKRMLNYEFNINKTDSNGWSPLHWAVASTEPSIDIVRLLLESECDRNIRDNQGRTALDLAIFFKRTEEIAILDDTAHAYHKSSENKEPRVQLTHDIVCDGCEIDRQDCKPEKWHHCLDCTDFDFCFRCFLDKDTIHFNDHTFSNEPA